MLKRSIKFLRPKHERRLWRRGYQFVAGVDEVGRGAWAGPLVAAAVIFPAEVKLAGINDSKLLTPQARRNRFYFIIRQAVAWGLGVVERETIDSIGLQPSNRLAFRLALEQMNALPDYVYLDALPFRFGRVPTESVIGGDRKIFSIAAASIIAKAYRDYLMERWHVRYPNYGFNAHKGYGTAEHRTALLKHGLCPIHRQCFSLPV